MKTVDVFFHASKIHPRMRTGKKHAALVLHAERFMRGNHPSVRGKRLRRQQRRKPEMRTVRGVDEQKRVCVAAKLGELVHFGTDAVIVWAGKKKRFGLGIQRQGAPGCGIGKRPRKAGFILPGIDKRYAIPCQQTGVDGADMAIGRKEN